MQTVYSAIVNYTDAQTALAVARAMHPNDRPRIRPLELAASQAQTALMRALFDYDAGLTDRMIAVAQVPVDQLKELTQ